MVVGQLGRVLAEVEQNYVDPVERTRLIEGATKGMVAELDPHSAFMPEEDYRLFRSETAGRFGGVGLEVDARHEMLTVIAPIEGSPAERAGIRSGDRIVRIDNEEAARGALDKVVRRMRGVPGSHVIVTIYREGVKQPIVFDLVREVIHVTSVAYKLLQGDIGFLRIKQFQDRTHEEVLAAAGKLRGEAKAGLRGIIIDLRSNPGGLVDEAAEVADELLSRGVIFTSRRRGEVVDEVRAREGGAFARLPAVVLINEWSASAAELVAGALQDNRRAAIVGRQSFGKGSVQSVIELPGRSGLKLTVARYYTPDGRAIQAEGIHPDVLIESERTGGKLPPIQERDLEGHLAAEGRPARRMQTRLVDPHARDEEEVHAADVRKMPPDPAKGSDFALRVAHEMLRAVRP